MRAPAWVVEELVRLHSRIRVGWWKRPNQDEGRFFILELAPVRGAEQSLQEWWGDRGPVYGPSFDHLMQVPLMVAEYSPRDFSQGVPIGDVKRWMRRRWQERVAERLKQEEAEKKRAVSEIAGEAGERLYRDAQRSWEGGVPIVANKHLTKSERSYLDRVGA